MAKSLTQSLPMVSRASRTHGRVGWLLLACVTMLWLPCGASTAASEDAVPKGGVPSAAQQPSSSNVGAAKGEATSTAAPSVLTFAVVAALVTTAGTLLGYVLKEVLLARSFELWKSRRASDAVYRKYRDPIVLAALELANRLREICVDYPTDFLSSKLLKGSAIPATQESGRDLYFRRYKCQGTAYRLAAFLAWLELYRQEIVFLDTGKSASNRRLRDALQLVRSDLADGHLNRAGDWQEWADALVFREEQRAIGEALIKQEGGARLVASYGTFVALLEGKDDKRTQRWLQVVTNFFLDPKPPKDFRRVRYNKLLIHLVELVQALDVESLSPRLAEAYKACQQELLAMDA